MFARFLFSPSPPLTGALAPPSPSPSQYPPPPTHPASDHRLRTDSYTLMDLPHAIPLPHKRGVLFLFFPPF